MNESNADAPAIVRRRRRIARQQREKTPEPQKKIIVKPKYSDDESSSTTTANEFDKRQTNPATASATTRLKSKTGSISSGGGGSASGNSSNLAYRDKILQRRDRGHRPIVRSQSQPREIPPESPQPELKFPSDSSGNVIKFLRQAKRSLSIPRYKIVFTISQSLDTSFLSFFFDCRMKI